MNERIEELLDQCQSEYFSKHESTYDMEKFAELIIRDCISLLGPESSYGTEHIKKHFGIDQ